MLDRKDGRLLVISLYGLDCRQYNETYTSVMWETCGLRSWLNSDFYNTAFNESQKESIIAGMSLRGAVMSIMVSMPFAPLYG